MRASRRGRFAWCLSLALVIGLLPSLAPAMGYAEHTPGFQLTVEGSRSYKAGHYQSALSRFTAAARWADKLAQFNIGVMHYHGQGVGRDLARASAWLQLAAERGYPEMVDMAALVREELNEAQLARAQRILEQELLPVFGDEVAIERTARRMERERRRATGSRTGMVGNLVVIDRSGRNRGGDEFFRAEAWDFRQIVALETRIFRALADGNVTLGDLEIIEDDNDR
jgi:uncharacterized protein